MSLGSVLTQTQQRYMSIADFHEKISSGSHKGTSMSNLRVKVLSQARLYALGRLVARKDNSETRNCFKEGLQVVRSAKFLASPKKTKKRIF